MSTTQCSVCLGDITALSPSVGRNKSAFSDQLSIFYLVNKLLDIPSDECITYLVKYGNPIDWVVLCPSCVSILEEAQNINKNILQLQNDLEILKQKLVMQMRVKTEKVDDYQQEDDADDTATQEIRRYVYSRSVAHDSEFPPKDAFQDDFEAFCTDQDSESFFFKYPSDNEDNENKISEPVSSHCITLTGVELENSLKSGNEWLCPVCVNKRYSTKRSWLYHIRTKHCQFSLHLDDTVPVGHKCEIGQCLPGSSCIHTSSSVSLTGVALESTLKAGNYWLCPVCEKKYQVRRIWREHIRKKHVSFLLHLDNKVPANHKCVSGMCLPESCCQRCVPSDTKMRKCVPSDKKMQKLSNNNDDGRARRVESNRRTAIKFDSDSETSDIEIDLDDEVNGAAGDPESDPEWVPDNDPGGSKNKVEMDPVAVAVASDSDSEELKSKMSDMIKVPDCSNAEIELEWKCHLCPRTCKIKKTLMEHFRRKHKLKFSSLPKEMRDEILAFNKEAIAEAKGICPPDRIDNPLQDGAIILKCNWNCDSFNLLATLTNFSS